MKNINLYFVLKSLLLASLLVVMFIGCTTEHIINLPSGTSDKTVSNSKHGYEIPLSGEMRQEIEDAWQDTKGYVPSFESGNARYYGTYGDCTVIFEPGQLGVVSKYEIAGSEFNFQSEFEITVYHDGRLMTLSEAYESGLLTKEQIAEIAEYHANYDISV